jgi:hypothetical protein
MRTNLIVLTAMALALAACSGEKRADADSAAGAGAQRAAGAADEPVAAVLQSAGAPLVQLQFVLGTRPVVGTPFTVQLVVSAKEPAPVVALSATSESLDLDPASSNATLALAKAGDTATHAVSITARHEGVAEIVVHLRGADADGAETTYAVPLMVDKAATTG